MKAAIIFDLDGTLIDSMPDVQRCLNLMLADHGLRGLSMEELRATIGHGAAFMIHKAVETVGGNPSSLSLEECRQRYLTYYRAEPVKATRLFEGVLEVLAHFQARGVPMGICSNKPSVMVHAVLESLELTPYFQGITGGDDVPAGKPHPDHLLETLRRMGLPGHGAVMVGDSRADVEAARNAEMPSVVVSFGYSEEPVESLGADAVIDHMACLPTCLDELVAKGKCS